MGNIEKSRTELSEIIKKNKKSLLPYEKWILSRLAEITEKMTIGLDSYNFSLSGSDLIAFIRDEFADFAIEAYKIEKDRSELGKEVISLITLDILTLLHPYAPHITETLYGYITGGKILANSAWPIATLDRSIEAEMKIESIFGIVKTIRNLRAERGIKPGDLRDAYIVTPSIETENLENNAGLIR